MIQTPTNFWEEELQYYEIKDFNSSGWAFEEYMNACQDERLYESIVQNLDTEDKLIGVENGNQNETCCKVLLCWFFSPLDVFFLTHKIL